MLGWGWRGGAKVPGVGGGERGCRGSLKIAPTDLTRWGENRWVDGCLTSIFSILNLIGM